MTSDLRDIDINTDHDQFGDMYYVAEDGQKIKVRDMEHARQLKDMEERLKRCADPMGGLK